MLDHEEYVEQAYFFRALGERLPENVPVQELMPADSAKHDRCCL